MFDHFNLRKSRCSLALFDRREITYLGAAKNRVKYRGAGRIAAATAEIRAILAHYYAVSCSPHLAPHTFLFLPLSIQVALSMLHLFSPCPVRVTAFLLLFQPLRFALRIVVQGLKEYLLHEGKTLPLWPRGLLPRDTWQCYLWPSSGPPTSNSCSWESQTQTSSAWAAIQSNNAVHYFS